jgi:hypothetical protein
MSDPSASARKSGSRRLLDPVDRVSEILFGLIMALTFTCTLSVAEASQADVRTMMIGALGCNLAWGLVDATMFLLMNLIERARSVKLIHDLRGAPALEQGNQLIVEALPPVVAASLDAQAMARLRSHLLAKSTDELRTGPRRDDWLAALGVFLLVVLSTFPVVIPFMLIEAPGTALRVSNGVAITMMYACGAILGGYAGRPRWRVGMIMAVVGSVLVAVTIALGG